MNCSFNIRYKPRTTRQFTKSDLTVYDSADNTALNAITVYGKSEVVDGAITSAGEGWSTVDLGTLEWVYQSDTLYFVSLSLVNIIKPSDYNTPTTALTAAPYLVVARSQLADKRFCVNAFGHIAVMDSDYTDVTAFKNSLNGVILAYQLADPTQGNCVAVKTDNGSGINGTMATFTTGTPLRGIPDTDVRDVMVWDGSSGEVTKKCGEVDLGTQTWDYSASSGVFRITISDMKPASTSAERIQGLFCEKYELSSEGTSWDNLQNGKYQKVGTYFGIKDTDYTDATAFKNSLIGVKLVYELTTPTAQNLTSTENASIAGLRTFTPQTHAQNNAGAEMTVDYTIRVPTI